MRMRPSVEAQPCLHIIEDLNYPPPREKSWGKRSQGGAKFPTGGVCLKKHQPASARFFHLRKPGSADSVQFRSRRSQSG